MADRTDMAGMLAWMLAMVGCCGGRRPPLRRKGTWGLVIVAEEFVIEGLGDDADELVGDVVGEEVAEVHDGGVILAAEPRFLFALALTTDVTVVAARNLFACAEVLPKAVFEEGLGQAKFDEASIGADWERFGAVEESPGVNHAEEGHLLFPYFEHGVVEGEDEFLALLLLLVIAILWGHSANRCKCLLQFGNRRTRSRRKSIGRFLGR